MSNFATMVLVTGGTGFVGSHLLLQLVAQGENVRAIYRNSIHIEKTKSVFSYYGKDVLFGHISWIQADITDIPSMEIAFADIKFVYHCAAFVSFDPKDEEKLRKINIEGTANMVNLALAHGIEKFCHVSSIAALGDLHDHETIITEETEWNPEKYHSDYAISKYGAEMEVFRAQQEGLKIVITNPGVIIGPGIKNESGEIFTKIRDGLRYYTKGTSGFTTVDDVVSILILLMKSEAANERYIAVNENISFDKLVNSIADNMNVKAPNAYAKKWMTEVAWRLDGIISALFLSKRKLSKATAKSLHSTDLYSNEKIIQTLDFKFGKMDSAIKTTAAFYANQK